MSEQRSARSRALARELREKRKASGLNLHEVAAQVGISIASLSRRETGRRMASVTQVAALLAVYKVVGPEQKRIMDMAEDVHTVGWWHLNRVTGTPVNELAYFESQASSIVNYSSGPVPGLLQTPAYARAVMGSFPYERTEVERRVGERMQRQATLHRIVPPRYTAFMDEASLRRPFGGRDAMVEQIRWLIDMAKRPEIAIRVIPFRRGSYDQSGYFSLLGFRDAPPLVFVEGSQMSGFLDDADDIDRLEQVVASLRRIALDSSETVEFLGKMIADHERG
ncbi:hypothetical protein [Alloactinosynnema sp. L-07]|uniref:helix-turn-helix domain-containing protein n=1 Tax=Alloactinosynnema sp. L-07 TaxID=1653480 RepID=UPI00065EF9C2|nr:helix-turn-helix transcriptional regulator [Alloactinosynnema sp. L-07]CRK55857.1 hypothetical protein [Alloactinosynnema sp. L-07]